MKKFPLSENFLCSFHSAVYTEKESVGQRKGWKSIDLIFVSGTTKLRQKVFGPSTPKQRRKTSDLLQNVLEVLGGDYSQIPYHESYEYFAIDYINQINSLAHQEIYIKTLVSGEYTNLGLDVPVVSLSPDLVYSDKEMLRVESYNERQEEKTVVDDEFPF